jgi:hypothetical protein
MNAPEDTLIHEIQHAIDDEEGFARGGSADYWQQRLDNGYGGNRTADELYRDTAGEISAREAAGRRTWTEDRRRATPPDIRRENAVFAGDTGTFSFSEQDGVKNIETLTEQDELDLLESVERGDYADRSYIPLRRNTPGILISEVERYTGGETTVDDLPIISEVGHLRQAMDEDSGSYDPKHRPHNISPSEMISIIKGMDDPRYIVLQDNGRYVEVVRYRGEKNGRTAWAVLDFGDWKYSELMNGYPSGTYNVLVTPFEPDDLESYMRKHVKAVVYDKAKDATSSGSNRLWSSHTSVTPFAEKNITSMDAIVNAPPKAQRENVMGCAGFWPG